MPVHFQIFPHRGFVLARFTGHILLEDCLSSAQAYAAHPDANPHQNQVIDLSGMTGYERDFIKMMRTMAQLPDHLLKAGAEPMIIYIASTPVAQEVLGFVIRSFDGTMPAVVRVTESEEQALEILGQPERRLADIPARAGAG